MHGTEAGNYYNDFVYELDFLNKIEYKIFVGVTWISLAGYMSQDIMKSNIITLYFVNGEVIV